MQREVIYDGHIVTVVKLDDHWEVVEHTAAVCVLALREGERGQEVLGVVQPRPAIGTDTWELPAGLVEGSEDPKEAALREFAEECQLTGDLTLLTQVHSSPGFCTEKAYVFEATNLQHAEGTPDESEAITLSWRNLKEVWREVSSGEVSSSAHALIALTYALGRNGQLPGSTS